MPHQSEALDGATGDRLSMMEPSKNPTATNPWRDLPLEPPYALASDRLVLERFNQKARPDHQIHLDLLPEPFLGAPDAPVVLLSLNPGFAPEDRIPHGDPTFQALSRAQLSHAPSPYPFLLLNPAVEAPGRGWWEKKLARLLETCGRERVARHEGRDNRHEVLVRVFDHIVPRVFEAMHFRAGIDRLKMP